MALEKYKICPVCGEHNSPSLLECRKCEADLTGVKVTDSALEQQEKKEEEPTAGTPALVRVCECGAHNPPQARKCRECGEDISDIMPTAVVQECASVAVPTDEQECASVTPSTDEQEDESFSYILQAVGDEYSVTMDRPVSIIGREAELQDYLADKMYVSRQHAKLTIVAGKVLIENLSKTNRTFINNAEISQTDPTPLTDGDEIGLGGIEIKGERQKDAAYFLFKVKS